MALDTSAAGRAVRRLGAAMGLNVQQAALGIVRVANEHMARALRVISVQRGLDPSGYVLASFGGAGGLHVCALAEALGMDRAMVPVHAGVLSALGMLAAPPGRVLTRTWLGPLEARGDQEIAARLDQLAGTGVAELSREGRTESELDTDASLDLRYLGQSYTLNLPWQGKSATAEAFHRLHEGRYGHRLDLPVELVNLRVRVTASPPPLQLPPPPAPPGRARGRMVEVVGCDRPVPLLGRTDIAPEDRVKGPAVIVDPVATTWLAAGWTARLDRVGSLLLSREPRGGRTAV
jgi:N-methylhydantoinase A